MRIKKIVFVCTGNTCKSVMAHKIFEQLIKNTALENLEVDSAGTAAMPYYAILGVLKEVMDEHRVDYSGHIPKMIDREILESADYVVVMTEGHREDINFAFPGFEGKLFLLSELAVGEKKDIPDPIGLGVESYRNTFKIINKYAVKFLERLLKDAEKD